ncbi:MAG: FHA domain-containing protein [Bdellovibrionota bacterium]
MSGAVPLASVDKYLLEILEGPDKGAQFQLVAGEIKIGRGDTNDVVLHDPRCSREHAILKITHDAVLIEDRGSSTGVTVDGQKGSRAFLSNGSKIIIGSTTFLFKKIVNQSRVPTAKAPNYGVQQGSKAKGVDPKKIRFYAILGVVVIIGLFLFSSNEPKKILDKVPNIDEEIELSKKRQEVLMKDQLTSGKASRQYLDAQASYTKGLRDYREGLYKSAVSAFSATLAIYPEHPTARRYLRLAQLKLDEQVQFLMQEGSRFMDQNKYQHAKASYKNVMVLLNDKDNKIYQEALEKHNECVLLLRESF